MVNPGEKFKATLKRKFLEEAAADLNSDDLPGLRLDNFLSKGGIKERNLQISS